MAESKGFEPLVPCGTTVFKTAAFDHSANSPRMILSNTRYLINEIKICLINIKKWKLKKGGKYEEKVKRIIFRRNSFRLCR